MSGAPDAMAPKPPRRPLKRRSSGVIVPNRANGSQRAAARLIFLMERLLSSTLRWRYWDASGFLKEPVAEPVIYGVWHNRLALSMAIVRETKRCQPERRLAALVSASRDGAFLSQILGNFGVHVVRGSTSRRGPQALLELTRYAEQGYDLAITPDGPRGPAYVVQEGIIALAQLSGRPIIPVGCRISRKVRARSWDRFQIPLPFAKCEVLFDEPIYIPRDASDPEREALRKTLEERLRQTSGDGIRE